MTTEQARQLIRRLSLAIENVLDGAEIDDGWVNPSALNRLDEVYEVDIKPLGPERMPPAADQDLLAVLARRALHETSVRAGSAYDWNSDPDGITLLQ